MKEHLKQGDIVNLCEGREISAQIPEKFTKDGKPYSANTVRGTFFIGDRLVNYPSNKEDLSEKVRNVFSEIGISGIDENISSFVESLNIPTNTETFSTNHFAGEYKVISSIPKDFKTDIVVCQKITNPEIIIDYEYSRSYK